MFYICSMTGLHILWFRQDLRVHDHAPLRAAALAAKRDGGEVLPLFIFEPDLLQTAFLNEGLKDLDNALEQRGAALHFRRGEALDILAELHRRHNILSIYAHETTRPLTADQALESWAMRAGIALRIFPQFGPERLTGGGWTKQEWDAFMAAPRHEAPSGLPAAQVGVGQRPTNDCDELSGSGETGGRRAAIARLRDLLGSLSDLSQVGVSPEREAESYYDQLASYLDTGMLSIRETWQAAVTARNQYISAGQDIRAARVSELIRQLPNYHRARYGAPARHPGRPNQFRGPGQGGDESDPQMSLDLDPTGTG